MQTPDVNVLVAAFLVEHPQHAVCQPWLLQEIEGLSRGRRLLLLPVVVASFLRLVTNPRIFVRPAPIEQALAFIDALLAQPGCEMAVMGSEWPVFAALCRGKRLAGNAIPDALIAASARQQGCAVVTMDRDFAQLLAPHELRLLAAH
jgi:uncharacterized protein